jgi:hypothetical protein
LPRLKNVLSKTITQGFLLFWFIGGISLLCGIYLTQTVVPHIGLLHYLRRVEVMMLFFVGYFAFTNLKQVKTWLIAMLLTTLFIVFYGFGQQYFSFPVISTTNREFSKGLILTLSPEARINSTFAGHYDLAAFLAMFLTVSCAVILFYKSFLKRIIIGATSLVGFILLSLTAARISFAAAVLGIISVIVLSGRKKLILLLLVLVAGAFIMSPELRARVVATITVNILGGGGPKYVIPQQKIVTEQESATASSKFSSENAASKSASLAGVPVDIAPGEPINTTELGVFRSYSIRFNEEWPRAMRAFYKNPFLGTGYSSITIATDNDYLRSLGEVGLLGTLSLALIFYLVFKALGQYIQKYKRTFSGYLCIGLLSMTVSVLVNAVFIDVFEASKIASIFWLSLGLGFAIINMDKKDV